MDIIYRPDDFTYDEFYEIDKECFPSEPLNRESFNEMRMGNFWTVEADGYTAGYAYIKIGAERAHLSRIAVRRKCRRRGTAGELLKTVIDYCNNKGVKSIDLSVQTDNPSAMRLYEKFGFEHMEFSCQYVIPIRELITVYKGKCMHNLTAVNMSASTHYEALENELPRKYELVFIDRNGFTRGNCILDPGVPGCSTFVVFEPDRFLVEALLALEEYLNPEKDVLILTFSSKELMRTCAKRGFKLNYELSVMRRR